jgi:hypothetical protein
MNQLEHLEKTARQRRSDFRNTLAKVTSRVSAPPLLVDAAVSSAAWLLDKYLGHKRLKSNHPSKTPKLKTGEQP